METEGQQIWARGCYTPAEEFIGCRQEEQHGKPVELCICDEDLCNAKMDDESTSTSTIITTTSENGKV